MKKRNAHCIGNGEYKIVYKESISKSTRVFKGVCENFNSNGVCAFWNTEKEQMLLVLYWEIVGLYPID